MSSFATLEIQYTGGADPIDFGEIYDQAKKVVTEQGYHTDVLASLRDAFDEGRADVSITAGGLRGLVTDIAALCPEAQFEVRACGEDIRDTWVAAFEQGAPVFDEGPWD